VDWILFLRNSQNLDFLLLKL